MDITTSTELLGKVRGWLDSSACGNIEWGQRLQLRRDIERIFGAEAHSRIGILAFLTCYEMRPDWQALYPVDDTQTPFAPRNVQAIVDDLLSLCRTELLAPGASAMNWNANADHDFLACMESAEGVVFDCFHLPHPCRGCRVPRAAFKCCMEVFDNAFADRPDYQLELLDTDCDPYEIDVYGLAADDQTGYDDPRLNIDARRAFWTRWIETKLVPVLTLQLPDLLVLVLVREIERAANT